jgi:hypothetical protein
MQFAGNLPAISFRINSIMFRFDFNVASVLGMTVTGTNGASPIRFGDTEEFLIDHRYHDNSRTRKY